MAGGYPFEQPSVPVRLFQGEVIFLVEQFVADDPIVSPLLGTGQGLLGLIYQFAGGLGIVVPPGGAEAAGDADFPLAAEDRD